MEAKQTNFSLLMFPWIGHGHVFPYLELAKHLSNSNFHIFFCSTAVNLSSISDALANSSSIQLVELRLPSSPDLPPHYHTTKNVPPHLMPKLLEAFQMSNSTFSNVITSLKPDMLIYDGFQPWAAKIASSLGIPAVHFATSGATLYSFYFHSLISATSAFPYEAIYLRDYERKAHEAMIFYDLGVNKNDLDSAIGHFTLSCDIVLMKTCRGIEGKYIDYLSLLCKKKLVPVGPLVTQAKSEEGKHAEIMEWLSKKNQFSTVFISFGSENYLSKDQMVETAKGLEAVNANFIWVARFPPGERVSIEEVVPKGFCDRVKDRGMILQGWAPQTKILAHPSTGAFLSHCGMSSMIESIYFGVPLIAMPLKLDQPLNARLAVEAGIGVEVERDEKGGFGGADVADAINKVLVKETGEDMRLKAAELSEKMKNEEEDARNDAADQLRQLCMEHKHQK